MTQDKGFTIAIKRSPDYKIYPFHTVYGGPTADMSGILLNVCVDHTAFPSYITHPIRENGTVDLTTISDQAQIAHLERELLCGLMISLSQAKVLVSWLQGHIDRIEGRMS